MIGENKSGGRDAFGVSREENYHVCGIVGYLNLNGEPIGSETDYVGRMCDSIAHRGPDERGMKNFGACSLGMTRLSIIDLKTGQQPITNEDGSIWIVFNGEIYNFHEIQERVRSLGHTLKTKSDTEVIVHLYEEYGVDCLQYLEGMFAIAIYDIKKEKLFIARDRMGEKPLHWTIQNGKFIFGSEIKAILTHPSVSKELDRVSLEQYLALEYVPAPRTIFKGIQKLMPAHYLVVEKGQVKVENYWHPEPKKIEITETDAREQAIALLSRSIELRLIADVPLGIFLSGGIDSSLITALAAEKVSGNLKTFSIGFRDASFDESDHAQVVSKHLGTTHECVIFEPELALETMNELWNVLDEPIADASIIPTFFLSKMTKRRVTVALAGEGGDELFGGYPTYQAHQWAKIYRTIPALLRHGLLEPSFRSLPVSLNNLSFDYKVKRFISAVDHAPVNRHLRWMGSIPLSDQKDLLLHPTEDNRSEADFFMSQNYLRSLLPNLDQIDDVVDTITRLDMSTYLPDDLLVKSDRASMAASLEVRLPFLAYPLVEFALSLPTHLKVQGTTTKYLLRQAAQAYLPQSIIKRPKKGFGIPVAKWLKNEFKPLVDELLCESFIKKQELFQWERVKALRTEHDSGLADRRKELWTLLMFQWWWRKFFLDGQSVVENSTRQPCEIRSGAH